MRHFATESGKSKGQFYTPAEVSRIIAKVIGIRSDTNVRTKPSTTPPAAPARCCSRSPTKPAPHGLTYALRAGKGQRHLRPWPRMNMILHDYPTAEIWQGNTLASPHFKEGRQPQDLRLRRRQSTLFLQVLEQRP